VRALVTGATGLVGAYLVQRLAADGWRVRALVRAPASAAWLEPLGAVLIRGDIMDLERLRASAAGCDVVFHTAAMVTGRGSWTIFEAANVGGTRHVIAAAESAGAKLVQVSSVAVYGGEARYRDTPTDEETPLAPLPSGAHYARSKRDAEALVLRAHTDGRLWATAVRPDVIYGRNDRQFVPRVARVMDRGLFPIFRGGTSVMAIVHAANVADGIVRAASTPTAGGRVYNLANDFPVTVSEFVRYGEEGLGRKVRRIPVPLPVARVGFGAVAAVVRVTRGRSMARDAARSLDFLSKDNPFSSERARRELGWTPIVRPEIGITEAFRWWREHAT
jgi:nucleoside-diphosphate-sugar epimerase